jgi:xylan 1,4-beta-xylosidase
LNYQDLQKPSFFAYKFLNRLGGVELKCHDPAAFVCKDESGGIQALFWDFTITHPGPSIIDQEYYKADHPSLAKGTVELSLSHLAAGAYRLTAYRVGYRANDVQAAWRDMGSPSQLTRSQVDTLRRASSGVPCISETVQIGPGSRYSRGFETRENDVWLVELNPLR